MNSEQEMLSRVEPPMWFRVPNSRYERDLLGSCVECSKEFQPGEIITSGIQKDDVEFCIHERCFIEREDTND